MQFLRNSSSLVLQFFFFLWHTEVTLVCLTTLNIGRLYKTRISEVSDITLQEDL